MTHPSAARASEKHLEYVQRDGVALEGGVGVLYGVEAPDRLFDPLEPMSSETRDARAPERPPLVTPAPGAAREPSVEMAASERLRASMLRPIAGEKHQFRIIISAEDAGRLDLTEFITRVMERVERDLGQPLIWAAANHYNTDDPHTHLIVRGVDRNGRPVRFDREYISRIWRERAQEVVTQELGPRTEQEIERQLQREVGRGRYTSLDRSIAARAVSGVVRSTDLSNSYQRERLKVLTRMGLAEQQDAQHWKLRDGWQAQLKADGERGDIIKQMYQALGERLDTGSYRIIKRFEAMPENKEITGRVVAMGLVDSSPGALFAVLETTQGQGYYVPLWQSEVAALKRGDLVTLKQLNDSWVKPLDRPLAELTHDDNAPSAAEVAATLRARLDELGRAGLAQCTERGTWRVTPDFRERWAKHTGVAYPARGRVVAVDALLELSSPVRGEVDLSVVTDMIGKRLDELAELGLAMPSDNGTRLDPHFVKALERRDEEQPLAHIALRRHPMSARAQVTYRGPTWLDTADFDTACPLTIELRQLREERQAFLKDRGIRGKPHEVERALVKLERDELAARYAHQRGRRVASKLAGFQGRVCEVCAAPSSNRYALIESASEIIAVRAGSKARKLVGRDVRVSFVESEYDGKPKLSLDPIVDRSRSR